MAVPWRQDPCRYGNLKKGMGKGRPDGTGKRSVHPREGFSTERAGQAVQLSRQLAYLTRVGGRDVHGQPHTVLHAGGLGQGAHSSQAEISHA